MIWVVKRLEFWTFNMSMARIEAFTKPNLWKKILVFIPIVLSFNAAEVFNEFSQLQDFTVVDWKKGLRMTTWCDLMLHTVQEHRFLFTMFYNESQVPCPLSGNGQSYSGHCTKGSPTEFAIACKTTNKQYVTDKSKQYSQLATDQSYISVTSTCLD